MIGTILSEFRLRGRSATIEILRLHDVDVGYRVITSVRYPTLKGAEEAYLSFVPNTKRKHYKSKIAESLKDYDTNKQK